MHSQKMGFWSLTSLVAGSQIGTGIFLLPASLITYGVLGFGSWFISGAGAVLLALVFARLAAHLPKTGGPHAFIEAAFGKTFGFFSAWTYWVISWFSSSLLLVSIVAYLSPVLGNLHPVMSLLLQLFFLAFLTALNLCGARSAGRMEFFLTVLKLLPLLIVPLAGLFFFNPSHFAPIETISFDSFPLISAATFLTFWGFIGVEAATAPAENVENPQKNIPRALVLGTLIVVAVYVLGSTVVAGVVPPEVLATSKAPFATAAQMIFGGNWHLIISIAASVICIGTLNAWILTSGQIALGAAYDGHLPKAFAKKNKKGAPSFAIFISSLGIVPVLLLAMQQSLLSTINFTIDVSVTAFLFVYTLSTLSYLKLFWKQGLTAKLIGLAALSFCIWMLIASGLKMILLAASISLLGLPIYLWRRKSLAVEKAQSIES
jgi:APA family basic amino acid/polyamine antiporter